MQILLVTVLRWFLRHLLSLAMIIALLLLGRAAWVEWNDWQSLGAESTRLNDVDHEISLTVSQNMA